MAENEEDLDDVDSQPLPPTPIEVVRRALILSGVVCRASLENHKDDKYRRQTAAEIHEWFDELALWPYLEARGTADPSRRLRHNAARACAWPGRGSSRAWPSSSGALRRGDFPLHAEKVDAIAVTDSLAFLAPTLRILLVAPALRPAEEIEAAREWFYDVHCTLRQFLYRNGDGHLASWIGDYVNVLGLNPDEVMAGKGLAFAGKPLAEADRDDLEDWEHVIREHHRALMWLEGDDEPYTELTVDT